MSRLNSMLHELGGIGRNEDGSVTRLGSSEGYFRALEEVKRRMESLGMTAEQDPVGNLHGILPGSDPSARSIVIGSHMDTVIEGGVFDGMLGVTGALEVVYRLKEQGRVLTHPLEIWGFNLEESSPVGGTFGSRCVVGMADPDAPGFAGRLARYGMTPDDVRAAKKDVSRYRCYLEYHIEQGGKLDSAGLDIGVVSGIVSVIRYDVTAHGQSNHAGTTMMDDRKDALVGMSKLIVAAEQRARELSDTLVFTVGKLSVFPGQENVIPGEVSAVFEMRHMDKAVTDRFYADIQAMAAEIPNCEFSFVNTVEKYSTPCDPELIGIIDDTCTELGLSHVIMPSGAGHDANPMAHAGVPVGLIFVPSVKGISHDGGEWTEARHVDAGADVLYDTVLKLDEREWILGPEHGR